MAPAQPLAMHRHAKRLGPVRDLSARHRGRASLSATGFAAARTCGRSRSWPSPVLLAMLLEARSISRALALRLGSASASAMATSRLGLNWIATAFTFQSAMPPWLGWIAVAAALHLPRRLPGDRSPGVAWLAGAARKIAGGAMALTLVFARRLLDPEPSWLRGERCSPASPWNPPGVVWLTLPTAGTARLASLIGTLRALRTGRRACRRVALLAAGAAALAPGTCAAARELPSLLAASRSAAVLRFGGPAPAVLPGRLMRDRAAEHRPGRIKDETGHWRSGDYRQPRCG